MVSLVGSEKPALVLICDGSPDFFFSNFFFLRIIFCQFLSVSVSQFYLLIVTSNIYLYRPQNTEQGLFVRLIFSISVYCIL
jgi:hypothetical protein